MSLAEMIPAAAVPVTMTSLLDTCDLLLSEIRIDPRAQPRDHLNTETAKAYADDMLNGAKFPPLTVFFDGDVYWLADGFHRHYAALGAGIGCLRCEIHQGGLREAVLYSCGANGEHGHRRSNDDKRRAVRRMLEDDEWRQWSDMEVARRCHVSNHLVASVRAEVSTASDTRNSPSMETAPNDARTFVHHKTGKPSQMETGAIGKLGRALRAGPRISVTVGHSVSDVVRKGMDLEAEGPTAEEVSKQIGIDTKVYRQARDIVVLAARQDLTERDSALARAALDELDQFRQSRAAHDKIKHLVKRIWGGRRGAAREAQRLEAFVDAITIITDVCDRSRDVAIPHLVRNDVDAAVKRLEGAVAALHAFKAKLREMLK